MSLRHAIMGFLSFQPMSGYELKKAFDQSVQHFWPADQSQIYRTLKQLAADGLIEMEIIPREDQLDIKEYSITEAGQVELETWLATPHPPADNRDAFLVQLYFAFMVSDEEARHVLQTEIDRLDEKLATYATVYEAAMQHSGDVPQRSRFYAMLTLEYGLAANTWYREWLQSVVDRIDAGDMAVLSLEDMTNPIKNNKE